MRQQGQSLNNQPPKLVEPEDRPAKVLLISDVPRKLPLPETNQIGAEIDCWEPVQIGERLPTRISLVEKAIDVILLDLSAGGAEPLDRFAAVDDLAQGIPIIVLTSCQDRALAVELIRRGAHSNLYKEELDPTLLGAAIRSAAKLNRMQQALNLCTMELEANTTRLRNIINRAADGIIIVDKAGIVRFANPAAETLFGEKVQELIGQPFGYPVVADDSAEIDILGQAGEVITAEMRVVETLWDREPVYLASMRDISKHKTAQRLLRQHTAELQTRNEDLDAFAHTVAHDLQSPLSTVLGFANALLEYHHTMDEKELDSYLGALSRSAHQMSNIIEELLLLAGVRNTDVTLKPLNMADIIARVQQRLAYMIQEYQAELVVQTRWPVATGYAPWVEEIWTNYISNAIKYGGQPPRVELGGERAQKGLIRFWVRDNGNGVAPEDHQKLFVPFTRLDQVRATGNGLGLSIVKRIVEKLGGEVWVESPGTPGRGSLFNFTLPEADLSEPKDS